MLDIPKLLREVDIVVVRILKSRDLVPKGVYLLAAVALDLLDIPLLIDAFALAEEWLKQLAGGVIRQSFALPCEIGVKKLPLKSVRKSRMMKQKRRFGKCRK